MKIVIEKDGNQWCCHLDSFVNLQESPAWFGDTPQEALQLMMDEFHIPK
jgi:hypothetical protein